MNNTKALFYFTRINPRNDLIICIRTNELLRLANRAINFRKNVNVLKRGIRIFREEKDFFIFKKCIQVTHEKIWNEGKGAFPTNTECTCGKSGIVVGYFRLDAPQSKWCLSVDVPNDVLWVWRSRNERSDINFAFSHVSPRHVLFIMNIAFTHNELTAKAMDESWSTKRVGFALNFCNDLMTHVLANGNCIIGREQVKKKLFSLDFFLVARKWNFNSFSEPPDCNVKKSAQNS